ncbi:MAG: uracil-DNA glycosylase [Pseudomonadota bacterium]|nr:uracil-DNA glycosylase [Pseudomonadota bacterium]
MLHHPSKQTGASASFDATCRQCARLADFRATVLKQFPSYLCRPVPSFGASKPKLLLVGLAPGLHGANRTGRPFTGDFAGQLLYNTLHRYGFATGPLSTSADDGLELIDCRITNAVKCLPPQNKPTPAEIRTCNAYLRAELSLQPRPRVVLALGRIAHDAVLMALDLKASAARFGHSARHDLANDLILFDSYHCSRYNTQTRRLTEAMFHEVFDQIRIAVGAS